MIGVAIVCIVSFIAIPRLLKKSKTDFVNVTWNEFRSPDQKFTVSLPASHKTSERMFPPPFGNAKATMLEAEISKEGGCMVMYADYPIERLNMSEDDLYEMAIKGAASRQTTMAIGARRQITVDGFRGVEAELRPTNTTLSAKGRLRIFWVAPRLYILGAGGPDTPEFQALQKRFFESFHLSRGL